MVVTSEAYQIYRFIIMSEPKQVVYSSLWGTHRTATELHLPHGITQCYLHLTQVNVPHLKPSHAGRYSIYLPRRDGRLS